MDLQKIKALLDKGKNVYFERNSTGFSNARHFLALLKGVAPNIRSPYEDYPTLYLCNHNGCIVLVKSLFPIKKGDILYNNYGKIVKYEDKR